MGADEEMKSPLLRMTDLNFLILYGSQLGQSKSIAEGLFETASEHDLKTKVFSLNEVKEIAELRKINCPLVIVTSTTGDGEAPENADKFFRKLRKKNLKSKTLHSVRYSILGLGDTNFNNFCNCGKTIHKRFQDLGATLFYPPAWADDAVGLDNTIDNWIEELWSALKTSIGIGVIDPLSFGDHIVKLSPLSSSPPKSFPSPLNMISASEFQSQLTLPACPQPIIELKYHSIDDNSKPPKVDLRSPPQPYPSIDGELRMASPSSARVLTNPGSVKTTLEVTFNLVKHRIKEFDFEPGDAIGIVCPNSLAEVNLLLERLKAKEKANEIVEINLKENVKGKIPVHVPRKSTLQDLFTYFLDIRTPPKKAFLRLLAEATEVLEEKNTFFELCSREGGTKYEESIRFPSLSILDLLLKYPSCQPRIESLIEHLPRLIPRAYSIASSPLVSKNVFTIAFNIVDIPKGDGRMYSRQGLCTGWLFHLAKSCGLVKESELDVSRSYGIGTDDLTQTFQGLGISNVENCDTNPEVIFYRRKNHFFRLPVDTKAPLIMVGPGTGVAPFIGFIEHREHQKESGLDVGPMTLYFGCRHKEKDFIYRNILERSSSEDNQKRVLSQVHVTYSRDADQNGIKYVQDLMERNEETVISELLEKGGYLYVCGDAKNMAKSVREKIIRFIQNVKGLSEKEATEEVTSLINSKRYLQDIWT